MAKIFKETFVSPFGEKTESDALRRLEAIRASHPESSGWQESSAYAEKREDGWHAVRIHQKVS